MYIHSCSANTLFGVSFFFRGAALANVERLLNCPSPHENNVTNDEKIVIGGGPAPWNTVGGTTQMAFSDDAAKEGQLTGELYVVHDYLIIVV